MIEVKLDPAVLGQANQILGHFRFPFRSLRPSPSPLVNSTPAGNLALDCVGEGPGEPDRQRPRIGLE
jgi:hypothetical protein